MAHLKSPAGSISSGHTIMAAMKMTITAMTVGRRKRRISSISASLSTDDASRAPAFFTCARQVWCLSVGHNGSVSMPGEPVDTEDDIQNGRPAQGVKFSAMRLTLHR